MAAQSPVRAPGAGKLFAEFATLNFRRQGHEAPHLRKIFSNKICLPKTSWPVLMEPKYHVNQSSALTENPDQVGFYRINCCLIIGYSG